jgi:hypothetical protein
VDEFDHENSSKNKQVTTETTELLPPSIRNDLPAMVRNEVVKLSAKKQEEFVEEYRRKAKSTGVGYLLWFVGFHHAYVGNWGLLILYWLTLGGLCVWWIIDLFRVSEWSAITIRMWR